MSEMLNEDTGRVKISEEVVAIIAGVASAEVEGVNSMGGTLAGGIAEFLGAKRNISKGIKADIKENDVTIDIHVVVNYGVKIPEMAWEIQEKVKAQVESMTGLNVLKVNIHIDGVNIDKTKAVTDIKGVSVATEE